MINAATGQRIENPFRNLILTRRPRNGGGLANDEKMSKISPVEPRTLNTTLCALRTRPYHTLLVVAFVLVWRCVL